jgi:hypothetical protein
MWAGEFVFSVSRDFVRRCSVPGLVLPGDDTPHPAITGRELAEILPDVETLHDRKGPASGRTTSPGSRVLGEAHAA